MNKQELIDKAVEQFKGNAKEISSNYGREGYKIIYHADSIYGICHAGSYYADCVKYALCSIDEFTKRARELGWINGYKWGVKYPTNGKKPDLQDDVLVKTVDLHGYISTGKVRFFTWERYESFSIVDERYKPVEVEQVQADWYDYDKQQAIALPPVGVECEVIGDAGDDNWYKCKIIGYDKLTLSDVAVFVIDNYKKQLKYYSCCTANKFRPLDYNRKVDEEKRKFVEDVASLIKTAKVCGNDEGGIAAYLYEQGCRFK